MPRSVQPVLGIFDTDLGRLIGIQPDANRGDITFLPGFDDLNGASSSQALVSADWNRNSAVILADSWGQYNYLQAVPSPSSIVDNGDGTATITGTSLKIYAGDPIAVGGVATPRLNQLRATVLSHVLTGAAVTSATYSTTGLYVDRAQSGGPFLYMPWRQSDQGWWHLGCKLAGVAPDLLANFGSGAADSEELELLLPSIVALRPKACFIQAGTNNVYSRNWAADRSIASFKRIVDTLVSNGITPVMGAIPPRLDGNQSAANAARTAPVNAWAAKYLPMRGGYFIQHWAASASGVALADSASAIGAASAGVLGDGVHPARPYAFGYGKALVAPMREIFPRVPVLTPADVTANGKLWLANPMLTGSGGTLTAGTGTISGTAPTGVTINNLAGTQTVVASVVARTEAVDGDAVGNKLRLVITNAISGSNILIRMSETPANWDFADKMVLRCGFQASSSGSPGSGAPVAMATPQLQMICQTATTADERTYGPAVQVPGVAIDEGYTMLLRTPPRTPKAAGTAVHGALSFLRMDLELYFRGAGSATVDIWHPCIEVLDATVSA